MVQLLSRNVHCSTAVSSAYDGRHTHCSAFVNSTADGRRTTDKKAKTSKQSDERDKE
ncbi:MAG: hypothetical protein HXL33_00650 [Prevotellaceae bacterium]|nr:hypothetical protein [Prevotellaceae bacterium]MBF1079762.1 hypothetical protein [Prevotellaceae bacterium]